MIWIQSQQIAVPTWTAEEWILYSSPVCVPEALSVYLQSHGADNNLLAQSWGESIISTWFCLRAALAALIWSRFCARTALSGLRGRPTGPDGSHLVLMPTPSLGGGIAVEGPFARTSLSHNFFAAASCSCRQKHAVGPLYTLN